MKKGNQAILLACLIASGALALQGCDRPAPPRPIKHPRQLHIEPSERAKSVDDLPRTKENTRIARHDDSDDIYFPGSPVPGGAMFGGVG